MKKIFLSVIACFTIFSGQSQNIYCSADFSYLQNGTTVIFSDQSIVVPVNSWGNYHSLSWSWDFGDGNTSNVQNPTHIYSNGIYIPCLTLTFFDSTIMTSCTSIYCDSIIVGNAPIASWDCAPSGCYDPGTGNGQYTALGACQAACGNPIPSWDCSPNMLGCFDPGTGNGQYTSLSSCQAVCGVPIPSWDCSPSGCYDPGTGNGQYTTLGACQAVCVSTTSSFCDSMTASGSQTQLIVQVSNINTIIDYWVSVSPDGTVLGEDSMSNTHMVWNLFNIPNDSITTCITYTNSGVYYTCCVTWIWDASLGIWAKMGSVMSIEGTNLMKNKLVKVVDVLGRESSVNHHQLLFFIYENGMIEKRYMIRE